MISVVVIGRNEAARLGACMEAIHASLGVLSHEIVYVDSRSTDDSVAIAKAHGARCFILEDEQTTAGLGRHVGAKEAKGEYLLFLDGDMQLQKGFCEKAMMTMAQRGYDGCCGVRKDVYIKNGQIAGTNDNYFACTQERIVPEFGGAVFLKAVCRVSSCAFTRSSCGSHCSSVLPGSPDFPSSSACVLPRSLLQ